MTVTLYRPNQEPTAEATNGFNIPQPAEFVQVPPQAASLLGCAPSLVDVLATGPGYVAYSIFDSEQEPNPAAMAAVSELTGISFDAADEDELLCGPVLIVKA